MIRRAQWTLATVLFAFVSSPLAAEPKESPARAGSYLCLQTQMQGNAAKAYAARADCAADTPTLSASAVGNGNSQCSDLCDSVGCRAVTVPARLRGTGACRGPDPNNQQWYGSAITAPFDCKCMNP